MLGRQLKLKCVKERRFFPRKCFFLSAIITQMRQRTTFFPPQVFFLVCNHHSNASKNDVFSPASVFSCLQSSLKCVKERRFFPASVFSCLQSSLKCVKERRFFPASVFFLSAIITQMRQRMMFFPPQVFFLVRNHHSNASKTDVFSPASVFSCPQSSVSILHHGFLGEHGAVEGIVKKTIIKWATQACTHNVQTMKIPRPSKIDARLQWHSKYMYSIDKHDFLQNKLSLLFFFLLHFVFLMLRNMSFIVCLLIHCNQPH